MATVELRRPYDGKAPGEKIDVDEATAVALVRLGHAAGEAKFTPIPESEKPKEAPKQEAPKQEAPKKAAAKKTA